MTTSGCIARRLTCAVLLTALLSSCATTVRDRLRPFQQPKVERQEDVAGVYVAMMPPLRWEVVASSLAPQFPMTPQQALSEAVRPTAAVTQRFIDVLSVALGLAPPASGRTWTRETGSDGVVTTTQTETRSPGEQPTAPNSPDVSSRDIEERVRSLSLMPAESQYVAATRLLQQVRLLNDTLTQGHFGSKDERVYLVTLQVNVQPRSRDLPYDVHLNATFGRADGKLVRVIPLLSNESYEAEQVDRSLERITQAAVQVAGVVKGLGFDSQAGRTAGLFDRREGTDLNSAMTVGQLGPSTIRVRLGASLQGSVRYALLPRVHNVSVLLVTEKPLNCNNSCSDDVRVFVRTLSYVSDAITGEPLRSPATSDADRRSFVQSALETEQFSVRADGELNECRLGQKKNDVLQSMADMLEHTGTVVCAANCLTYRGANTATSGVLEQSDPETLSLLSSNAPSAKCYALQPTLSLPWLRVVSELSARRERERFRTMSIVLPRHNPAFTDKPETKVLMVDDNESTTARLTDGQQLQGVPLRATLVFPGGKRLPATSTRVAPNGQDVTLQFPSLATLKLSDQGGLKLVVESAGPRVRTSREVMLHTVPRKPKPNPIFSFTPHLLASDTGTGEAALRLEALLDAEGKPVSYAMVVGDARLVSASETVVAISNAVVPKLVPAFVTLKLSDLSTSETQGKTHQVTFRAVPFRDGKVVSDTTLAEIKLPVVGAPGVKNPK